MFLTEGVLGWCSSAPLPQRHATSRAHPLLTRLDHVPISLLPSSHSHSPVVMISRERTNQVISNWQRLHQISYRQTVMVYFRKKNSDGVRAPLR
jgi:hypothetical protein